MALGRAVAQLLLGAMQPHPRLTICIALFPWGPAFARVEAQRFSVSQLALERGSSADESKCGGQQLAPDAAASPRRVNVQMMNEALWQVNARKPYNLPTVPLRDDDAAVAGSRDELIGADCARRIRMTGVPGALEDPRTRT
jgi:hypothetical protein